MLDAAALAAALVSVRAAAFSIWLLHLWCCRDADLTAAQAAAQAAARAAARAAVRAAARAAARAAPATPNHSNCWDSQLEGAYRLDTRDEVDDDVEVGTFWLLTFDFWSSFMIL